VQRYGFDGACHMLFLTLLLTVSLHAKLSALKMENKQWPF
jgi:hypothetical protein